ncbi:hypothetical protein M405DRAFT_865311 [Rhizopogon salebrosus TDB-379]|nr:hypothetical protein M405DRAFT_865311 [Rhizopogon salebrosus TDB-379]
MSSAVATFFGMRDMVDELMTHVDFLPDVLALRRVSREIYRWSRAIPDRRRECILRRFFDDALEHFLAVMAETGTIITGSCALNMLLGNRYDAGSSDLNLIVPHEKFRTMDAFLRKLAGYVDAEEQMEPHSSYFDGGHDFYDGGGRVATLYPEFTLYGKNLYTENEQWMHGKDIRIGSSKSDVLALESDTCFLGEECGCSCPSLWRSFKDYGPYGVFNWDGRDDVRRVFANCDVEWRVGERCVNPQCERDYNRKERLFGDPSSEVPADEVDIGVQEEMISNRKPVCGSSVQFGFVEREIDEVIDRLMKIDGVRAFGKPRDLEVGYWVNQRDPNGRVTLGRNFTEVVHCGGYRNPASFTIFCENFMNLPPTNGLLRKFRVRNVEHIEGGNVLIIKHPLRQLHRIENMTHADIASTGKLLEWAMRTNQYWI